MLKLKSSIVVMGTLLALGSGVALGADPETQKQIDDLKAVIKDCNGCHAAMG